MARIRPFGGRPSATWMRYIESLESDLACADARCEALEKAIDEVNARIQAHPTYANLTEDEENVIGGDTAELSYLSRVLTAAKGEA